MWFRVMEKLSGGWCAAVGGTEICGDSDPDKFREFDRLRGWLIGKIREVDAWGYRGLMMRNSADRAISMILAVVVMVKADKQHDGKHQA